MKNICKIIRVRVYFFVIVLVVLNYEVLFSQETVIWNNGTVSNTVIGTTPTSGVNVIVYTSEINNNYNITPVTGNNNLLFGRGPYPSSANGNAADQIFFNFSVPVIITDLYISDINSFGSGGAGSWNDSFTIINANFQNSAPNNGFVSPTGVHIPSTPTMNLGSANFLCSNPIQNFNLNFDWLTNDTTSAWLYYRIDLIEAPLISPICLGDLPPDLPVVGNGVQGTWSSNEINSNVLGDTVYTFTPSSGQTLQCPITMTVTVQDCCVATLISNITISAMMQREREDWISSSDVITFGDGIYGNGVVYHAGNFVEFTPGFEAIRGSQFSAYIEGCSGDYTYKTEENKGEYDFIENFNKNRESKINLIKIERGGFKLIPNPAYNVVKIVSSNRIDKIVLTSIDGRQIIFENINSDNYLLNIENFYEGIYIVTIFEENGNQYSEKLIKR